MPHMVMTATKWDTLLGRFIYADLRVREIQLEPE